MLPRELRLQQSDKVSSGGNIVKSFEQFSNWIPDYKPAPLQCMESERSLIVVQIVPRDDIFVARYLDKTKT